MLPSHIEARGKEKISNSDLVNLGFWGGVFILIKKYCTGTLFVLITEFLAHPCIGCPRRYLTHLPLVLVLPQPLCRPHLGRLHSVCSGTQARNPGSSVAPLLPFTHLSRPPPSISQDCPLFPIFFAAARLPPWAPVSRQERLLGFPCKLCSAPQHKPVCAADSIAPVPLPLSLPSLPFPKPSHICASPSSMKHLVPVALAEAPIL